MFYLIHLIYWIYPDMWICRICPPAITPPIPLCSCNGAKALQANSYCSKMALLYLYLCDIVAGFNDNSRNQHVTFTCIDILHYVLLNFLADV